LCELIPGGVSKRITAGQAAGILGSVTPPDAVAAARCELAAASPEDLRGTDAQLRDTRKKLTVAVRAAGTSLTGLSGVGPVIAAAVIGDIRDVSRFPGRDHFAASNGTAPIEVSAGQRKIYRLSRRGNRRLSHAIHMAAVTQVSHRHSQGRAYHDRRLAEGKTPDQALRSLKRQISDAIFARLPADARRAAAQPPPGGPGRATGERLHRQPGRLTPPVPALRATHSRACSHPTIPAAAAEDPATAPFPASLPPRASGRAGQRPGAARPRSGARRASLTQPPASR
jgi:hypothetical protein